MPHKTIRRRPDGSTYEIWRCGYRAVVWTLGPPGSNIWNRDIPVRFVQGNTPGEAEDAAALKGKSYDEYDAWMSNSSRFLTYDEWHEETEAQARKPYTLPTTPALDDEVPASRTFSAVVREYYAARGGYDHAGNYTGISNGYRNKIDNYLMHARPIDTKVMSQLRLPQITAWFAEYQRRQSQPTAARFEKWCQMIGRYAETAGYWPRNLFNSLPKLSLQPVRQEKRVYSFAEIDALWEHATNVQQRALMVLLRLGLRFGEATGLTRDCLQDDDTILIKYAQVRIKITTPAGGNKMIPQLERPKTKASIAKVHVPKPWMEILRESVQHANGVLIRAWDDDPKTGARLHHFVASNTQGNIWQESAALEAMKRTLTKAGVVFNPSEEKLRGRDSIWHSWRYTYASELMVLGASDIDLRYCMRHTDSNLSKQVYAQARFEDRKYFEPYIKTIKTPVDFNQAICDMDTDRRNKTGVFAPPSSTDKETHPNADCSGIKATNAASNGTGVSGHVAVDGSVVVH